MSSSLLWWQLQSIPDRSYAAPFSYWQQYWQPFWCIVSIDFHCAPKWPPWRLLSCCYAVTSLWKRPPSPYHQLYRFFPFTGASSLRQAQTRVLVPPPPPPPLQHKKWYSAWPSTLLSTSGHYSKCQIFSCHGVRSMSTPLKIT